MIMKTNKIQKITVMSHSVVTDITQNCNILDKIIPTSHVIAHASSEATPPRDENPIKVLSINRTRVHSNNLTTLSKYNIQRNHVYERKEFGITKSTWMSIEISSFTCPNGTLNILQPPSHL